jgi:Ca2+/Na+ antiporter
MIHEVRMDRPTQLFNFPAMLAVMGMLTWMLWTDGRLSRKEGIALATIYGCYLALLIALTVALQH